MTAMLGLAVAVFLGLHGLVLSTVVLVAMWDGRFDLLVEKDIVGVAINVAVVALLVVR